MTTERLWHRAALPGDVWHVVHGMRDADAQEVFALRRSQNRANLAAEILARMNFSRLILAFGLDKIADPFALLELCEEGEAAWLMAGNFIGTADFPRIAPFLVRFVRRMLIPALLLEGVNRVECRVMEKHHEARKFINACGAREECRLADFGSGREPFVLCAWTRTDLRGIAEP